jgi:hypothetical protein
MICTILPPHPCRSLLSPCSLMSFFMQKAVHDVQPDINKKGIGFKGFIPATFATQVAERFSKDTGLKLRHRRFSLSHGWDVSLAMQPLSSVFSSLSAITIHSKPGSATATTHLALVNVDEHVHESAAILRLTSQLQNFQDLRPTLGKTPGPENS